MKFKIKIDFNVVEEINIKHKNCAFLPFFAGLSDIKQWHKMNVKYIKCGITRD
jgi:hypothetical protein